MNLWNLRILCNYGHSRGVWAMQHSVSLAIMKNQESLHPNILQVHICNEFFFKDNVPKWGWTPPAHCLLTVVFIALFFDTYSLFSTFHFTSFIFLSHFFHITFSLSVAFFRWHSLYYMVIGRG